jgi:serine/threonine protein kinase
MVNIDISMFPSLMVIYIFFCSGYMAPEYVADGNVSTKIDIFSFGVLVLEIVIRRRNSDSGDHDNVNLLTDVSA